MFGKEDGLPRRPFPNGWKGESGLYAVGFTKRGLLGASMDAKRIAEDIERCWKADAKLCTPTMQSPPSTQTTQTLLLCKKKKRFKKSRKKFKKSQLHSNAHSRIIAPSFFFNEWEPAGFRREKERKRKKKLRINREEITISALGKKEETEEFFLMKGNHYFLTIFLFSGLREKGNVWKQGYFREVFGRRSFGIGFMATK